MADLDIWLAAAARRTAASLPVDFVEALDRRLAGEPAPAALATRREARRVMLCAGLAALLGFTACGSYATAALATPSPTWVATPSAGSPFGLLVGE